MGKRNKGELKDYSLLVTKTKKKRSEKDILVKEDLTEEMSSNVESSGTGKNKKNVFDIENSTIEPIKTTIEENTTTRSTKRINNKTKQNKNIIFTEDKQNEGEQKDNSVTKTKKKRSEKDILVKDDLTEEMSSNVESSGTGKNKKIVFDNDETSRIEPIKTTIEENTTTRSTKRINNKTKQNKKTIFTEDNYEGTTKSVNNKTKQNKKIIFTDDNDDGTEVTKNIAKRKKNGLSLRECAEEGPGDEEIDKFCDELDEEDNVQYDNWVKLIETKLCPNKKK